MPEYFASSSSIIVRKLVVADQKIRRDREKVVYCDGIKDFRFQFVRIQ